MPCAENLGKQDREGSRYREYACNPIQPNPSISALHPQSRIPPTSPHSRCGTHQLNAQPPQAGQDHADQPRTTLSCAPIPSLETCWDSADLAPTVPCHGYSRATYQGLGRGRPALAWFSVCFPPQRLPSGAREYLVWVVAHCSYILVSSMRFFSTRGKVISTTVLRLIHYISGRYFKKDGWCGLEANENHRLTKLVAGKNSKHGFYTSFEMVPGRFLSSFLSPFFLRQI